MPSRQELVVGIDAGTGTIRAVAFDLAGRMVAKSARPTPVIATADGGAEHQGQALLTTLNTVLAEVAGKARGLGRVRALSIASFGETLIPVGRSGAPVGPGLAWYDPRPADAARELEQALGRDAIALITGLRVEPTYGLAKIRWTQRACEKIARAAAVWLSVADWLAFSLSGMVATDPGLAARSMAFDLARQCWSTTMLDAVGLDERALPAVVASGTRLGPLRPGVAARLGLPDDCIVAVGGYDRLMGVLACGVGSAGSVLDSLGTAEGLFVFQSYSVSPAACAAAGFNRGRLAFGAGDGAYLFGGLPTAGEVLQWLARFLGADDAAKMVSRAAAIPPDPNGPLFLPTLRLASAPDPDRIAKGGFLGIGTDTSPERLTKAVLEGLAMEAAAILEQMGALGAGGSADPIVAVGGATRHPLLMRLKAACFDRVVEVPQVRETSALGAAICAAAGCSLFADLGSAAVAMTDHAVTRYVPDPDLAAFYRERIRTVHVPVTRMLVRDINPLLLQATAPVQRSV